MSLNAIYLSGGPGLGSADSPGFAVSEGARLPFGRGQRPSLYTLSHLTGLAAEEVTAGISDSIHEEFAASAGRSVTTALTRALRTGLDTLDRENARALPQHRAEASIIAASPRQDTVYLAAAGGAMGFHWTVEGTTRVVGPLPSEEMSYAEEAEITLGRVVLTNGALVLLSAEFGELFERECPALLADVTNAEQLAEAIDYLHQSVAPRIPYMAIVLHTGASVGAAPTKHEETPLPEQRSQPPEPLVVEAAPPRRAAPVATAPPSRVAGGRFDQPPKPRPATRGVPPAPPVSKRSGISMGSPVTLLPQSPLVRIAVAVVGIALIAFLVFLVQGFLANQSKQSQIATTLATVAQKEQAAAVAPDPASKRWLLTEAQTELSNAAAAGLASSELTQASERVKRQLDAANGVTRLTSVETLADFKQADQASQPAGVLVVGESTYVLDEGLDGLWRISGSSVADGQRTASLLWRKGSTLGEYTTAEALAVFQMHSSAPGIPAQVYVLDSGGLLIGCNQATVGPVHKLPTLAGMASMRSAAGQSGNLYLFGKESRAVYRYTPGANGYESEPQPYLTETQVAGLANAVDMSVDGNLYLLMNDGRVIKYAGGELLSFPAVVPDIPVRDPLAIYTTPTLKHVYVADSGNGRILQFTKEGQYVRQLRTEGTELIGLRAISVDEQNGRVLMIVGTQLMQATLPVITAP